MEAPTPEPVPEPIEVNFIDRDITILDPNMDQIDRIGFMARQCYKNFAKEGEDVSAVNTRIIKHCISNGHESVLEHGVFSLYLPTGITKDGNHIMVLLNNMAGQRVIFREQWGKCYSRAGRKYLAEYFDTKLAAYNDNYKNVNNDNLPEGPTTPLPVIVGDGRAWRNAIKERLFRSVYITPDPLSYVITCAALKALHKVVPVLFDDIYDCVADHAKTIQAIIDAKDENKKLSEPNEIINTYVFSKIEKLEERTVDGICDYFFSNSDIIFAGPSDPSLSCSVLIRTDRAVTHQVVRHREDVAYSQESQRYVNYGKKGYEATKFVVDPVRVKTAKDFAVDPVTGEVLDTAPNSKAALAIRNGVMQRCAEAYDELLKLGVPPESARDVLPNGFATSLGVTWLLGESFSNLMRWRIDSHAQFTTRRPFALMLLKLIEMKHPFAAQLNPAQVKEWIQWIEEQNLTDADRLAKIKAQVDEHQKKIMEDIQEAEKKMAEREEAARKEAEANGGEIKVMDPITGCHVAPGQRKVVHVGKSEDAPTPDAPVVQQPPKIDYGEVPIKVNDRTINENPQEGDDDEAAWAAQQNTGTSEGSAPQEAPTPASEK